MMSSIFNKQLIGEDTMSSLADREAFRTERPLSRRSVPDFELWFRIGLVVVAVIMIAAAVAGSYAGLLPPETFFVGP
jgi:hypothetical protein